MSGQFLLDGSALAISLFNTLLMVWLGLTVLFNAERRTWGVILASDGLLIGAAFFFSHSVILNQGAQALVQGFSFWWRVGWAPVIASPYAWYLLTLWYSGYWDEAGAQRAGVLTTSSPPASRSALRRRQTPWLWLSVAYTLLLVGLLLFANPLPDFTQLASLGTESSVSLSGVPLLLIVYPPYILLCTGLALDALLRPAPSGRVMGDLARRRARPWLIGVSLVLLLVSLMIGAILVWIIQNGLQHPALGDLIASLATPLSWLDLILAALLMAAMLLLGQAVVSYEIFTGKTLPRRGFLGQWRNAILMAASFSMIAAFGLTAPLRPVYTVLLLLLLMAFFFAYASWRSYAEREQSIRQLRPLAASQGLFEQILTPASNAHAEADLSAPFGALCHDVLGAKQASLVPLGALAALSGSLLNYPDTGPTRLPPLADLLAHFDSPQMPGIQLDPARQEGYAWAAPLWSERGLIGLLLLGEKKDGGFYSLEEIEIARAGGERLADLQASAEIARRLMALERQRLAESQVLDRRARRALHDDVLPRLHTALLSLSSLTQTADPTGQEALELLASVHRQVSDLLHELPPVAAPEVSRLGLIGALRQVIDEELSGAFDDVSWQVTPEAELQAQQLPPLSAEVVYYAAREAARNAAHHARLASESPPLRLQVSVDCRPALEIRVEDNGVGIGTNRAPYGSGQGLALHSTMMAVIGGSLALESVPGEFTRVTLHLPDKI
ncbi:MAG TPA: ATP-binding protein [Anaerolineales bacterium]